MLAPRPSASVAPSIWYADVAAPQTKSAGKCRPFFAFMTHSLTGQARLSMPNFMQSPLSPLPCAAGTASGRAREVSFSFLLRRFRGRRISNRTEGEPHVKGVILGPRRARTDGRRPSAAVDPHAVFDPVARHPGRFGRERR